MTPSASSTQLRRMVREYESQGCFVVLTGDPNIARVPIDGFPGIRLASARVKNRRDFDAKFIKALRKGGLGSAGSFRTLHGGEHKCTYRSLGGPWGSYLVRADPVLPSSVMMSERVLLWRSR